MTLTPFNKAGGRADEALNHKHLTETGHDLTGYYYRDDGTWVTRFARTCC